jgi:UDPglucose 6-dehydrogenase
MNIAVIGAGYVGLVSAACFAELGHEVIAIDSDSAKVKMLCAGEVPIHEEHLPELIARHHGSRLWFSDDIRYACAQSDVIFICVGTPITPAGEADLSFVDEVARELAAALNKHKVIVEKSTVPVGTAEALHRAMALYGASPTEFSVASNPEFLREGTAVMDFLYPDRILIGVSDKRSQKTLSDIYKPILDGSYRRWPGALMSDSLPGEAKQIVTTVKSAEMIKHASNAFLALKISFINSVANVCERVGADVREVALGMGTDSRIGHRFLNPGIGYGGSCFPKDVLAFRSLAASVGFDFGILSEVMKVNEAQKRHFVEKVRQALWTLRGKTLGVLGLAFKGGTDDCRESPAIDIVRQLRLEGAKIVAYDPVAAERAKAILNDDSISFPQNAYDVCQGADALLILTEWPEFSVMDWRRVRSLLKLPIVLDGKNLLDPVAVQSAGLHYFGVGTSSESIVPAEVRPAGNTQKITNGPHAIEDKEDSRPVLVA